MSLNGASMGQIARYHAGQIVIVLVGLFIALVGLFIMQDKSFALRHEFGKRPSTSQKRPNTPQKRHEFGLIGTCSTNSHASGVNDMCGFFFWFISKQNRNKPA